VQADELIVPWLDALRPALAGAALLDAHTHIGVDDPDGFRCTAAELLEALDLARARGIVFAMQEPGGYPPANDAVLAAAQASGGRLIAFCRVDPNADPLAEARRCLDAGARGIKLHPRAEGFTLAHPAVGELCELAAERGVPVLTHAGRGIPSLGRDAVALTGRLPGLRLILAHAAITDLSWIWSALPERPNLMIDTSWWNPVELLALLSVVPPGHLLLASDAPYGTPALGAAMLLRCAIHAGLSGERLSAMAGRRAERVLAGEELPDLGPAPGPGPAPDPLLERLASQCVSAIGQLLAGGPDAGGALALARLGCRLPDSDPRARVAASAAELLAAAESALAAGNGDRDSRRHAVRVTMLAAAAARCPDAPLPEPGAVARVG